MRYLKRGDICKVDFGIQGGSVQSLIRPAIVIQNNTGNRYSPTIIVVPLTSKNKNNLPTHLLLEKQQYNFLHTDSIVIAEQVITISKAQVKCKLGKINDKDMFEVDKRLAISMSLNLAV